MDGGINEDEVGTYTTTYTTITKTNTLDIALTLADVWIVKYSQEFNYTIPDDVVTNNTNNLEDIPYPDLPDSTANNDTYGYGSTLLQDLMSRYSSYNPSRKL